MGERADQIAQEIQQQRAQLGANLHELESRIESATDWREHFRKYPFMMMGLAFGSGLILSGMFPPRRRPATNGARGR
jgi:hypothetical protein